MNTKLLVGLGAVAIAVGAYVTTQSSSSSSIAMEQLEYVPADTALFWGQLTPFEQQKYLSFMPKELRQIQDIEEITELLRKEDDKHLDFLATLLEQYNLALTSPEQMKAILGMGDTIRSVFYTVGLLPSLRYEVADPEAFQRTVKMAAKDAGITYQEDTLDGVALTRYKLEFAPEVNLELITSVQGQWITTTFNTPVNTEADLKVALGIAKPAQSLAQSGKLEQYTKQFGFDGASIAFLNHVAIIDSITANKQSDLTRMLDNILQLGGGVDKLASVRVPECQADYSAIANQWPATVMGTKNIQFTNSTIDFEVDTVVVGKDTELMKALGSIRGFIPAHVTNGEEKVLGFGYGVDVAKVAPLVNTLWGRFTKAEFSCSELVALQQQAKQNSPMAIAMMTGMANSVKGVSASVFDLVMDQNDHGMPEPKTVDALVTLSAEDPLVLVNTVKGLAPMLGQIQIPEDGSPVSINQYIPSPEPLEMDIKLAVKGDHLVLFTGEKATVIAEKMANQALETNGMTHFSMDMQAFLAPMLETMKAAGQPVPESFDALLQQNMVFEFSMDVAEHGLVFGTDMKLKKL
ncbi:hypothetical protein [Pseudoalteromonas piscicida]|uniref:DUF3352 domain-containing protein n=1 Tax=Pseudoalteromonas piscicida TaxID=43662 RepID=A0A2A5JNC5_PSEO7|nr:hypothetical protein [Pseudoalteromonas piscicida]PCK30974.1 hypothetical protein CEX98_14780 [Pseudoalteromonas piscicida]